MVGKMIKLETGVPNQLIKLQPVDNWKTGQSALVCSVRNGGSVLGALWKPATVYVDWPIGENQVSWEPTSLSDQFSRLTEAGPV